jgi:hypothetical protein
LAAELHAKPGGNASTIPVMVSSWPGMGGRVPLRLRVAGHGHFPSHFSKVFFQVIFPGIFTAPFLHRLRYVTDLTLRRGAPRLTF